LNDLAVAISPRRSRISEPGDNDVHHVLAKAFQNDPKIVAVHITGCTFTRVAKKIMEAGGLLAEVLSKP
jgi:hypothetical protein